MNSRDAVQMISDVIPRTGGTWVDLGAGDGTFTRALAEQIGPNGRIYAVDHDAGAISILERWAKKSAGKVILVRGDFTHPLDLPELGDAMLDGLLFANALHFVPDPGGVLARLATRLRPGGQVVIVEYDRRPASRWVPYPLPFERLAGLAEVAGLSAPMVAATRPSDYGCLLYTSPSPRDS